MKRLIRVLIAAISIFVVWIRATTGEREAGPNTESFLSTEDAGNAMAIRTMSVKLQACLKELETLTEVHYINYSTYADHTSIMTGNMNVCDNMIVETLVANEDEYHFTAQSSGMTFEVTPGEGIQAYE